MTKERLLKFLEKNIFKIQRPSYYFRQCRKSQQRVNKKCNNKEWQSVFILCPIYSQDVCNREIL